MTSCYRIGSDSPHRRSTDLCICGLFVLMRHLIYLYFSVGIEPAHVPLKCPFPLMDSGPHAMRGSLDRRVCPPNGISCLFQASFLRAGGIFPELTISPSENGCQMVCCKFFFGRHSELQIYRENLLLTDKKH